MATYVILNLVFLGGLAAWLIVKRPFPTIKPVLVTVGILFIFTAIFDSLIVGLGIVDYNYDKTLGIRIGTAPIEDFFYAILSGILVPAVWNITRKKDAKKS